MKKYFFGGDGGVIFANILLNLFLLINSDQVVIIFMDVDLFTNDENIIVKNLNLNQTN